MTTKDVREGAAHRSQADTNLEVWVRRGCALVVAAVAAYASYEHQRAFALHGGADRIGAALWPLSVDGLLVLATVSLLKPGDGQSSGRMRYMVRLAFGLGITVSLAANIAAAPSFAWQPMLVAGWPPVALLLAVELLTHRGDKREGHGAAVPRLGDEESPETDTAISLDRVSEGSSLWSRPTAEQAMWEHFQRERTKGRTPTGAELDRVVGTNNYGRAVLARWRRSGQFGGAAAGGVPRPACEKLP